jgi:hypothetical protein
MTMTNTDTAGGTLLDKEILDLVIVNKTIRDMSSIDFLHWVAKKIDGVPTYSAATQELVMAVSHSPMSNSMSDGEKIRLIRKMQSINLQIP